VVVFEKFNSLSSVTQILQGIGLIVIDELQMMGDETRGAGLELLLTKILLSPYKPQLLGLSAVLGDGEDLARWLRAELVVGTSRPVELRKGVLSRGVFSYLEHNSGTEGEEKWPLPEPDEEDLSALHAAKYFAEARANKVSSSFPINRRRKPGVKSSRTWSIYHLQPVPYGTETFEDLTRGICCCLFSPTDCHPQRRLELGRARLVRDITVREDRILLSTSTRDGNQPAGQKRLHPGEEMEHAKNRQPARDDRHLQGRA
jgi:hypothetical protein